MNQHLQQTIVYLSAQIAKIQDAIRLLQELGSGEPGITRVAHVQEMEIGSDTYLVDGRPLRDSELEHRSRARLARRPKHAPTGRVNKHEQTRRYQEAISSLKEPFKIKDLVNAMPGLSGGAAVSTLFRLVSKGVLKKDGPGQWKRTTKWRSASVTPAPVPPAPPSPAAEQDVLGKSLQEQLEFACRQRDRCRESGNARLVAIHQQSIDRLTAKLGTLEKTDK